MTTNQTIDGVPGLRDLLMQLLPLAAMSPTAPYRELSALLDAPSENVINLDAVDWAAIREAASESTWMPPEYMRNDWVSDVCRFLREGPAAQHQGEPVALPERSFVGDIRNPYRHTVLHDGYISGWNAYQDAMVKLGPLYAKQRAPVAVVLPDHLDTKQMDGYQSPYDAGWNACLDELKRLNTARPIHANPPPGTEPCGTHHDNDGLDDYRNK